MSEFGYGWLPDRPEDIAEDLASRHVGLLLGRDVSFVPERDWSKYLDVVLDQGKTNTCVWQWLSNAVFLAGAVHGVPVVRPSVRYGYAVTQWLDRPYAPLRDVGCRAVVAMRAAQKHGLIATGRWPFDAANVTETPPFDCDIAGADALLTGWYRVDNADPAILRTAVDRGHFPGFAIDVHENFEAYRGKGVYDTPAGAWLGRHMLTVVGYTENTFKVLNSWGTGWGDDGFGYLSDAFVMSRFVRDRLVVTGAPAGMR